MAAALAGEAAYGQLNVMRDQFEAAREAERPWIGFRDLPISAFDGLGHVAEVTLVAVNTGRSPARVIEWNYACTYTSGHKPPVYQGSDRQGRRILLPGADAEIPMIECRRPEVLIARQRLYVFSEIIYEDLRNGRLHVTRACWFLPDDFAGRFAYCEEYNEAD